jgi:glutathione S-transferase
MAPAILTISSRNYGAWSLRGWLLCRMSGLDFTVRVVPANDPGARAELLLLSPSFLVPSLEHEGVTIWDTLAIGEYLSEVLPEASLLPADAVERARCRSVSGEMHAGFQHLRSSLPMNVKARHPGFKVWDGAQADLDRIVTIWEDSLLTSGGPFLFGGSPTVADAMYAPVCTRAVTYDVELPERCRAYVEMIMNTPEMMEWIEAAVAEPDELEELEAEF